MSRALCSKALKRPANATLLSKWIFPSSQEIRKQIRITLTKYFLILPIGVTDLIIFPIENKDVNGK